MVKLIKRVLHVLLEVTAGMVNQCPLTKSTSDDPRDLSVLMPASFIASVVLEKSSDSVTASTRWGFFPAVGG